MLDGAIACAIAAVVELVTSEARVIANVEIRANSLALRVNEWTCLLSASIVEIDPARVPDTTYDSTSIHRAASTTVVREEQGLPRTDPSARHVHR